MIKKGLFCALLLIIVIPLFSWKKTIIKQDDGFDFLEKLIDNNLYIKWINSVEIEGNFLYLLDLKICTISRVDIQSGKLINTISSKGQGPNELSTPINLAIKNNLIFISDFSGVGIKIFNVDGKPVKEFKTERQPTWIDVDSKNQIWVNETNLEGFPVVNIYNINGQKIKNFVEFRSTKKKEDKTEHLLNKKFIFQLDSKENLVVLHYLQRLLKKYNPQGKLLWEKEIKNEILDSFMKNSTEKISYNKNTSSGTRAIFGMDIDANDNILVGQAGGGAKFRSDGEELELIIFDPPMNFDIFKIFDHKIININSFGRIINIYPYK